MALIYDAQLVPSKIELLAAWMPTQPWWTAMLPIQPVGAYRFDDPAGEVGIETHLVHVGAGHVLQVPLTYRGAPLPNAEIGLITTMHHSVLGQRWVYDACFDPVYATALATAILTGGTQAELHVQTDDGFVSRVPTTTVIGSGSPGAEVPRIDAVTTTTDQTASTIRTPRLELVVRRPLAGDVFAGSAATLTGAWPGSGLPRILAMARRR